MVWTDAQWWSGSEAERPPPTPAASTCRECRKLGHGSLPNYAFIR